MASERDEDDRGVSPSYPLIPIRATKKKGSNLTNITNITKDDLSRINTSFYLASNINVAWRQYCRLSGNNGCWLIEEAFIEYMRNHPLLQVTLSVVQDLKAFAPDVKDRLQNKIIKDKLKVTMATLCRIRESGRGDQHVFRKQLQKLALQATNLRRPDSELLELLKEVERLL